MGNRLYIVDYDIPQSPARERVQFYRDMEKLCGNVGKDYSTFSVFRTEDKVVAEAVYLLVKAHGGRVHLYVGEEVFLDF